MQMVRHTSKTGVTFLEDLAQLAVSHTDSSGPVFVDSLHVMTELLKDPVLREEALRAIPPGLTDHGEEVIQIEGTFLESAIPPLLLTLS